MAEARRPQVRILRRHARSSIRCAAATDIPSAIIAARCRRLTRLTIASGGQGSRHRAPSRGRMTQPPALAIVPWQVAAAEAVALQQLHNTSGLVNLSEQLVLAILEREACRVQTDGHLDEDKLDAALLEEGGAALEDAVLVALGVAFQEEHALMPCHLRIEPHHRHLHPLPPVDQAAVGGRRRRQRAADAVVVVAVGAECNHPVEVTDGRVAHIEQVCLWVLPRLRLHDLRTQRVRLKATAYVTALGDGEAFLAMGEPDVEHQQRLAHRRTVQQN